MKLRKSKAIYAILVGISIIGLWLMLFSTGQIPELETKLFDISLHIISELILAITLILSGIALLRQSRWSEKLFLLSMGLLIYSVINAAGYYGQDGNWAMVLMFAGLLTIALIFTAYSMRD